MKVDFVTGSYPTIRDCWQDIVSQIHYHGKTVRTQYGIDARYMNGMLVQIADDDFDTMMFTHAEDPFCTEAKFAGYEQQFTREYIPMLMERAVKENNPKLLPEYTYLDRFVNYDDFDQLAYIVWLLNNRDFVDSRRLQAITWMPRRDLMGAEQPCFQRFWVYPDRFKNMELHIHYRSWDIVKAFESNIKAISRMVKREVADKTGYEINVIRCFGDNVHYYTEDMEKVKRVVA